jgi:hypothetical protein
MNIVSEEDMVTEMPVLAAKALQRLPNLLQASSCGSISDAIVALAVSCLRPEGDLKPELQDFLSAVVEGLLPCIYAKAISVQLSASQEATVSAFSHLMCDLPFWQRCLDSFSQGEVNECTFNPFFFKFCEQLLFVSVQFKINKLSISKVLGQVESSKLSIVHYVGGFIIRGFANKCWKFQNKNKQFKKRLFCIQNNFIETDSNKLTPATKSAKLWTVTLNRGGLFVLGQTATSFFIRLTLLINEHKATHKSIRVDDVLNEVYVDTEIMNMWTTLTPELNEQQKLIFLDGVVKAFTNLLGHATAKKEVRMYEVRQDAAIRTKLKK